MTDVDGNLIERLEKATAPDRELDCEIALATGRFRKLPPKYEGGDDRYALIQPDGGMMEPGQAGDMLVPRYTGSIDAALKVGEAGWEYSISTLYGIADVEIPLNDSTVQPVRVRREHGHVPTALCEAILRAREAQP